MRYAAPIIVSLTLVVAACGQNEADLPVVPAPPAQDNMSTPAAPARENMSNVPAAPPPPADPAPTATETELPKPGQNNDHSSPEFKKGGASAPRE